MKWYLILLLGCFHWLMANSPGVSLLYPDIKINPLSGRVIDANGAAATNFQQWNLLRHVPQPEFILLKGETLRLQLVVSREAFRSLQIQPVPSLTVAVYHLGMVTQQRLTPGRYPDVLLPLRLDPRDGTVQITPMETVFLPSRKLEIFWLEISASSPVPKTTLPLRVHLVDGTTQTIPLHIRVVDATLPDPPVLIDFNEYGDKYLRALLPPEATEAEVLDADLAVFRFFRKHGGVLNPLPYKSQRGTARRGMVPRLLNDDLLNPELDWDFFDRRFGRYFDGSAFSDGQPLHHFYLPFNPNWPAPFELYFEDREKYEQIWAAFARAFREHFEAKGWTRTIFQIYCNQKPNPKNRIPWHLDEPKGVEDYRALRYYAELTHRVFGADSPVPFKFRIDIAHFFCNKHRGNPQKDFRVNRGFGILEPVDIWVISIHSLTAITARLKARQLQEAGREVWVYGNTPALEESGPSTLGRIYQTYFNGWNGFLVWKTFTYQTEVEKSKDFVANILTVQGKPQLLPSLRLKMLRQALEDLQWLEWLIQQQKTDRETVTAQLKSLQDADYSHWWQFRQTLHQIRSEVFQQ
ncbi:MAG: hypothetical protein GXO78_12565 [Calditrichaeota bacterium]|nr:hypothetical protein [Calditrichota bacterium]